MYELFSLRSDSNHEKIHLRFPPVAEADPPVLIADCGLHNAGRLEKVLGGPVPADIDQREIAWHKQVLSSHDPKTIANLVYAQLVCPFCNVICLFADDIDGGVARMLAAWLQASGTRHLPSAVGPRVLVLMGWDNSLANDFGEELATAALMEELGRKVGTDALSLQFSGLRVLAIPAASPGVQRSWMALRTRILQDAAAVQDLRRSSRTAFGASHLKSLIHAACDGFAADFAAPFCLLATSRCKNPVPPALVTHLVNFIRMVYEDRPSGVSDFAVPVIASALVLDSYPPGMHRE